jgi:hypothetical protein
VAVRFGVAVGTNVGVSVGAGVLVGGNGVLVSVASGAEAPHAIPRRANTRNAARDFRFIKNILLFYIFLDNPFTI